MGTAVPAVVPDEAFRCEDGQYLAVSAFTDKQWRDLCRAAGVPDLGGDPSLATNEGRVANREQVSSALAAHFATKPVYWWTHLLNRAGVPPFAQRGCEQQLRHLGRQRADRLYDWLLEADLGLKGSSQLPARTLLERLVVRLARKSAGVRVGS